MADVVDVYNWLTSLAPFPGPIRDTGQASSADVGEETLGGHLGSGSKSVSEWISDLEAFNPTQGSLSAGDRADALRDAYHGMGQDVLHGDPLYYGPGGITLSNWFSAGLGAGNAPLSEATQIGDGWPSTATAWDAWQQIFEAAKFSDLVTCRVGFINVLYNLKFLGTVVNSGADILEHLQDWKFALNAERTRVQELTVIVEGIVAGIAGLSGSLGYSVSSAVADLVARTTVEFDDLTTQRVHEFLGDTYFQRGLLERNTLHGLAVDDGTDDKYPPSHALRGLIFDKSETETDRHFWPFIIGLQGDY